jgi:hypothetical protein
MSFRGPSPKRSPKLCREAMTQDKMTPAEDRVNWRRILMKVYEGVLVTCNSID